MADARVPPRLRRWSSGLLVGVVLIAAVSGLVALLERSVPELAGLPSAYLLAVLPVAIRWGAVPGVATAAASVAAFAFLFVPPRGSFVIADARYGITLGVFVFTAVVVAWLAARSRRDERKSVRLSREQAGLRRVATLVAGAARPREVLAAVNDEIARLLEPDLTTLVRFETDGSATFLAGGGWLGRGIRVGRSMPVPRSLEPLRDGTVVRIDDLRRRPDMSETVEKQGLLGVVGCPVVVEGRVWGAFGVGSRAGALPASTEQRLVDFTELIGVAIANAESRTEISRLLDEQGTLRGVATLVARGVPPAQVFERVTDEIGRLIGADIAVMFRLEPDGAATVMARCGHLAEMPVGSRWELDPHMATAEALRTGRPARRDDYRDVGGELAGIIRRAGARSSVAMPIVVEGRIWGALSVGGTHDRLPAGTERRIAGFAELVGTAIANTESRAQVARLLGVQAALHRVATLVAGEATPDEVVPAVTDEIRRTLGAEATLVARLDADGLCTIVAQHGPHPPELRVGLRWKPDEGLAMTEALRTGRPAVRDGYAAHPVGEAGTETIRAMNVQHSIALPIVVEGKVWGAVGIARIRDERFPPDVTQRVMGFAELLSTAVRNTENRAETRRLLEEQSALRRVATVVARGGSEQEVFAAAAGELAKLLGADVTQLYRFHGDPVETGTVVGLSGWEGGALGVGLPVSREAVEALRRGEPLRIDDLDVMPEAANALNGSGVTGIVVSAVVVEGRTWGAFVVGSRARPLPAGTEPRLASFAELIATAIANTESRAEVLQLLAEQRALRRVATLVATGPSATEVSRAVAEEVRGLLGVNDVAVCRYGGDGEAVLLVGVGERLDWWRPGTRRPLADVDGCSDVWLTGRPVRLDSGGWDRATGAVADRMRQLGVRSAVAVPVTVDGRLWGAVTAWSEEPALPADTEQRMARFTELVAMAIGNATIRAQLAASRARIVAASDETRRRIERDLHDGAQQRLVSLGLELRLAQSGVPEDLPEVRASIGRVVDDLGEVLAELRELARGIHPAMLSEGGLRPALSTLARRASVPVELDVTTDARFPEPVEVAAYFVVSEALTNAAKHADASSVAVALAERDGVLRLSVRDDGVGGADPHGGSGLIGLRDRVEALGGRIDVESPRGGGTSVQVTLPVDPGRLPSARL
jgi:signal transduction histidine kinase